MLVTTASQPSSFTTDAARLNVALTRARRHLVVMGAAPALARASTVFADLVAATQQQAPGSCARYLTGDGVLRVRCPASVAGLDISCWAGEGGGDLVGQATGVVSPSRLVHHLRVC